MQSQEKYFVTHPKNSPPMMKHELTKQNAELREICDLVAKALPTWHKPTEFEKLFTAHVPESSYPDLAQLTQWIASFGYIENDTRNGLIRITFDAKQRLINCQINKNVLLAHVENVKAQLQQSLLTQQMIEEIVSESEISDSSFV